MFRQLSFWSFFFRRIYFAIFFLFSLLLTQYQMCLNDGILVQEYIPGWGRLQIYDLPVWPIYFDVNFEKEIWLIYFGVNFDKFIYSLKWFKSLKPDNALNSFAYNDF